MKYYLFALLAAVGTVTGSSSALGQHIEYPRLKPSDYDYAITIMLPSDQIHDQLKAGDRVDITAVIPSQRTEKPDERIKFTDTEVLKNGKQVDVIAKLPSQKPTKIEQTPETLILQNVEVLSVELQKDKDQSKNTNKNFRLVLRVTLNDSLRLKAYQYSEAKVHIMKHKEPASVLPSSKQDPKKQP